MTERLGKTFRKIGFLLWTNSFSGGHSVAFSHARNLSQLGNEVVVIFVENRLGLDSVILSGSPVRTALLEDILEKQETFDVMIAVWWECIYRMHSIPAHKYFYLCQSDDRLLYSANSGREIDFINNAYSFDHLGFIVVARWMVDWLTQEFGAKAVCAPNGIDDEIFNPDVEPLVPRGTKLRVLIEGAGSSAFKRVGLAFKVAGRIPGIEVWFVSSDGYVDSEWIFDRKFERLDQKSLAQVYASCDILLKLSSVESFSLPPLEMMATGGVTVLTRFQGSQEYARDGENCLLVDIDDEDGAVEALGRLVQDHELRRRLIQNGAETANGYSWIKMAPLFADAVEQLESSTKELPQKERYRIAMLSSINDVLRHSEWRISDLERRLEQYKSSFPGRVVRALNRVLRAIVGKFKKSSRKD